MKIMNCCGVCGDPETAGTCAYNFRQQESWSVTPTLVPRCVILIFSILGLFFLPIGAAILAENSKLYQSARTRYDLTCPADTATNASSAPACTFTVDIPTDLSAPIYFYYGIENMFQNARKYVSSVSYPQLAGTWPLASSALGTCSPVLYDPLLESDSNPEGVIIPCGLQAFSTFNDSFRLCPTEPSTPSTRPCTTPNMVTGFDSIDGIAWDSDIEKKFLPGPTPPAGPWTVEDNDFITNPQFMVWMRVAPFTGFVKLHRVITEDLPAGTYTLSVDSRYPVASFDGEKFVQFMTTGWYGRKNNFLGGLYVATGALCWGLAAAFLILHKVKPRPSAAVEPGRIKAMLIDATVDDDDF